jgi:hypothetical protein
MLPVTVLESVVRRAPLGIRFYDLARGANVGGGLTVKAWPIGRPADARDALVSPMSGIYGFRSLPGLRDFEAGDRPAAAWCGSPPYGGSLEAAEVDLEALRALVRGGGEPPLANFVVTVQDREGRFLPQTLFLCLPREQLLEAPLFSSPARPALPGAGVMRAELWERGRNRPAAWALVAAQADGLTFVGVADARGMAVIFLPYARPLPPMVGSPPYGGMPLGGLSWPLRVEVLYQPDRQRFLAGRAIPDTRSVIEQPIAHIYRTDSAAGAVDYIEPALTFRQDLVLATAGNSRLLVDPV